MKTTKIISWNVNGLRSILNKGFKDIIADLDPDIICLQETRTLPEQVILDLTDYEEFWNSAEKKGYSGTAIFTKKKPLNVIYDLPEDNQESLLDGKGVNVNKEGRVLTHEYEKFYLVTVYTPNSKRDLFRLDLRYESWDPKFLQFLMQLEEEKPVIFCGDLNVAHNPIDLARPEQNKNTHGFTEKEREGFDNLVKAGFIDTFRYLHPQTQKFTWWTNWARARERNIGWRIDYFCVSNILKDKIIKAEILDHIQGSDHCPVLIEFSESDLF
ncbi:MAG: exodeoxyribonuclease III [Candidatus Dojkabacteria bacterium]|uniref:Exodeoxyribonuclease n=2 Tax=Candidatus Dojkabacteria TaxID=74243 RepID=A0A136KGV8_9BACT|nr:MAG: Exodeoxyribonuclease [candidate division WS6 bacterium OLB21]MBW7953655.1 exodeoxyribonuclease III [Candidatus Dojkabacteria bacterium]WKZ28068.1 MAG: exodeoxyribonuclease III [Candidatus Dojkabacteria bacterium]